MFILKTFGFYSFLTFVTFLPSIFRAFISTDMNIGGWKKFYKSYPDSPGIITISRPGFSRGGKIAVIYMWNQVADLSGRGRIFVLENRNGKWLYSVMVVGPLNVIS